MGQESKRQNGCKASLHFPGAFRYLALVRETTLEVCEEAGLDEFKAAQLEMAVDEACANVIEHSYGGACTLSAEPEHPGFSVRFYDAPDSILVEIKDFGAGFDFDHDEIISPEEYITSRNERGLGLFIISKFVDQVDYTRNAETGNTMRLTKRL